MSNQIIYFDNHYEEFLYSETKFRDNFLVNEDNIIIKIVDSFMINPLDNKLEQSLFRILNDC